ncbi:Scr1 family TA system antitoxin-like transcriptional regulator [Nocardiopsis mangrovi]|uniref:Scr1 family TA system antitoxin-like transcriptional regulator n=1 Tax=Nocardiopsis mangrovi TaxID=1179818 RepID=A0ABV9E421_9ACTN
MADQPPVPALIAYGREVRRFRNDADLTLATLAGRVRSNKTALSLLENGKFVPNGTLREALDEVIGNGRLGKLWNELTGEHRPEWRNEVASAIRNANAVYDYQALTFPSYLQTEAYATTLVRAATPGILPEALDERVAERVERSEHIRTSLRPMLWLVLDGTVLRRRYGGGEITREQLVYVAGLAEAGRLTLQVVPEDCPDHPGNSGTFRVLSMGDGSELAYVESAERGQILTGAAAVARRRALFAALQAVALGARASVDLLRAEIDRIRP